MTQFEQIMTLFKVPEDWNVNRDAWGSPYSATGGYYDELGSELDIPEYSEMNHLRELQSVVHAYPIYAWTCTDSVVGLYVICLVGNDRTEPEPVAVRYQSARKSTEDYYWISDEAIAKTRAEVLDAINYQREVSVSTTRVTQLPDGFMQSIAERKVNADVYNEAERTRVRLYWEEQKKKQQEQQE